MTPRRLAAWALVSVLCACTAPARIVRETSAPRRPDWIARPPQDSKAAYFVGLCSAAETLEAGQQAAVSDALAKVARFIGNAIETQSRSYLDEVRQDITQQIQSHAAAKLRGAAMIDWYYEKITRVDASFSLAKYDVYTLIRYDRDEAERERRRQSQQREAAAALALRRFQDAQGAFARGDIWRAGALYSQADALLRGLDEAAALKGSSYPSTIELAAAVKEAVGRVSEALRAYSYNVSVSGPPEAAQAFRASLMSALSKRGYASNDRSAAFSLLGEISIVSGQILLNSQVYSASGYLSARRAESGPSLATVDVQAKGLHAHPLDAAVNAARDAAAQAGEDLAEALRNFHPNSP